MAEDKRDARPESTEGAGDVTAAEFNNSVYNAFHGKRFEPEPRVHDGAPGVMHYKSHRFPIKGGISLAEVMLKPQPIFWTTRQRGAPRLLQNRKS